MITRAPRPTSNFYLLDKAISEDKRLGWAARGLLIFLLGKPDNWTVSPVALVNETAKATRGTGRDGVYAILKELKDAGYLRTVGARSDAGIFAGADYIVCESPHTEIPDAVEKPDTVDLPYPAQPYPANPTLVSTEKKQVLKEKQGLKSADAPVVAKADSVDRPEEVSQAVWTDFVSLRKDKRAKLTNTALAGIKREADKAGWTLEAALAESCARGWTGFKAEWVANKPAAMTANRNANKHAAAARAIWGNNNTGDFIDA